MTTSQAPQGPSQNIPTGHYPQQGQIPQQVSSQATYWAQRPSQSPASKPRRKWPFIVGGAAVLIVVVAAAGDSAGRTESPTAAVPTYAPAVVPPAPIAAPLPTAVPAPTYTASVPETFAATPPQPTAPALSVSRQNAVESAESYLDYTAFSRQGLIDQLKYEDFSTADATYAVDHVTVDWNEQAAKSAKNYLEYTSFSRGGLIDQLKYEGFTSAQAKHGADSVGL